MNSVILLQDFLSKSKQNIESISLELTKYPVDTKEALLKIKQLRGNLNHIHNLLKLEESLENEKAS